MAEINQTIPPQIWLDTEDDTPWEILPLDYAAKIQQDIQKYRERQCQLLEQLFGHCPSALWESVTAHWDKLFFWRPRQYLEETSKYQETIPEG